MTYPGQVVEVVIARHGASLLGDHTAADTSILVDNATPFDENGGQVLIDGEVYDWTAVDEVDDADDSGEANGLLTITPGLVGAVADGTPVDLWSGEQILDDVVLKVDTGEGPPAEVVVAADQRDAWSSREGSVDPPVAVVLSDDLTRLEDAPGWTPSRDLRSADPTTVPPAADGVVPAAPVLTVSSGPGLIFGFITPPTTNADGDPQADAVRYNVYAATTEGGVTADPALLVSSGPEVVKSFRNLGDGTPFEFKDVDGEPVSYYFAASAVDNDGESALSPVVSASMNTLDASAYLTAGTITAELMRSVMSLSGLFTTRGLDGDGNPTGQGTDMGALGLFSYDAAGNPRVALPNDPSLPFEFHGNVYADFLIASQLTVLLATSLAQGAVFTLQSSITAPQAPPTVSVGFVNQQFTDDGKWGDRQGWSTDGTYWYTARQAGSGIVVEKWNSGGTLASSHTDATSGDGTVHGTVAGGGKLFILYTLTSSPTFYRVKSYSTPALVFDNQWFLDSGGATSAQLPVGTRGCAIGYDSGTSELLLAQSRTTNSDKVRIRRLTLNFDTSITWGSSVDSTHAYAYGLSHILYGSFDLGANRYIFGRTVANFDFQVVNTSGVQQAGEQWTSNLPGTIRGMDWNGTNFKAITIDGVMQTYEAGSGNRWTTSTDATWYAAYNWTNGASHTPVGPIATFTMKKRARVTITAAALAAGTTGADIYLAKGSTPPTSGTSSMRKQAAGSGTPPSLTVTNALFGSNDNPTTNTFGAGTPAQIRSEAVDAASAAVVNIKGDGSGRVGPMSWNADGSDPLSKVKASTQTVTSSTTKVDCTDIAFPVVAGGSYIFRAALRVTGQTAGDIAIDWTHPGGTITIFGLGPDAAMASGTTAADMEVIVRSGTASPSTSTTYGLSGSATDVFLDGSYVATSAGTVQMRFAQAVSNATGTQVVSGSFIRAQRTA